MADKDKTASILPLSRVKTIMKSSPDVSSISQGALYITGKATELFIQALAKFSLDESKEQSNVEYKDLAAIVNTEETLQFLQDIIPRKVKAQEYFDTLKNSDEDEET